MTLTRLYRVVEIEFYSLRSVLGPNMGVIPDYDVKVYRKARRVLVPGGLKWQLCHQSIDQWDITDEIDQEVLDEIGQDSASVQIFPK